MCTSNSQQKNSICFLINLHSCGFSFLEMTPPLFAVSVDWQLGRDLYLLRRAVHSMVSTPLYHSLSLWYNLTNIEPTPGCQGLSLACRESFFVLEDLTVDQGS